MTKGTKEKSTKKIENDKENNVNIKALKNRIENLKKSHQTRGNHQLPCTRVGRKIG